MTTTRDVERLICNVIRCLVRSDLTYLAEA